MKTFTRILAGLGVAVLLTGCAQKQETGVIYAEPTFNKFGDPSCRPGDVPVGGIYTADLPICPIIGGMAAADMAANGDGMSMSGDMMDDGGTDADGGGNNNQNRNRNTENTRNQNESQSGS